MASNRPDARTDAGIRRDLAIRKRRTEMDVQALPLVETEAAHGADYRKLTEMIYRNANGKRPITNDNLRKLARA